MDFNEINEVLASSETAVSGASSAPYDQLAVFGQVCLSLAVIISILLVLAKITQKIKSAHTDSSITSKIVHTHHLGAKQKIVHYQSGDRTYILGVTKESICTIDSIPSTTSSEEVTDGFDQALEDAENKHS